MKPLLKSYLDREVVSLTNDNDFFLYIYVLFFEIYNSKFMFAVRGL